MALGRKPITVVEIDVPFCAHVFGTAPCTAALSAAVPSKCFNSRATCADLANYSPGTQTLRFAYNQTGLPKGQTIFPALRSVDNRAAQINLSGIDPASTALGKRARVTITMEDFGYHDTLTDKYRAERLSGAAQHSGIGYDPAERGTFWGKLLARQPYLIGASVRVLRGEVGQALAAMDVAHYVLAEQPVRDAGGTVTMVAKDILDLAENSKARAPAASRGKLIAAIADGDASLTLTPAGVGAEYPASGRVAVGREVMTFTRSGDVLTLTARGVDGTAAAAHKVGDVAQVCLRYQGERLCDVIRDLLITHAGVSTGFIDQPAWQAEEDAWLAGLAATATITKPEGVARLIGEICQLGVMVWWDETAQEIRFRANRPLAPGETYLDLTDTAHILRGSPEIEMADDQRISALFLWHGTIDPTESVDAERNYDKLVIAAVSDDPYGQDAIKVINTRWFGQTGDDAAAGVIAERLLERYRVTPKRVVFAVDVKDKASLSLGGLVRVDSYLLQDATGAASPEPMQINLMEVRDDRIQVGAETYSITGRFGFWMQDPLPDYDTASDTEKSEGAFWMDDTIGTFPDGTGPYVYF